VLQFALHHQQTALLYHLVIPLPHRREQHQIHLTKLVFDGHKSHILVLFGQNWLHALDQPPNDDFAVGFCLRELIGTVADFVGNSRHIRTQRMVRNKQPEQFFFPTELLIGIHTHIRWQHHMRQRRGSSAEKIQLTHLDRFHVACGDADHLVDRAQQRLTRAEGVHRAHLDEAFQRTFAHLAQVHPQDKIVQIRKSLVPASLDDRVNRSLPHVFDRSKPKADARFAVCALFDRKVIAAVVNVRRQYFDAHVVAFRNINRTLIVIVFPGREQGSHIFDRIVILQVSGFDRDHAVVGGMTFVKPIMREGFPMSKNIFGDFLFDAVFDRAFDELFAVFFDFLDLLLRDRRPQVIRLTWSVACQLRGSHHDLLLVDRVSVSLAQDGLQFFVLIDHWLFTVHVGDIFRDAFHRTWSKKGDHGNNMMNRFRLHLHQVAGHSAAFQLEETNRMPFADELVDLGVIDGNSAEGELDAVALSDILTGFRHDGEGHKPKKIHFQQAKVVDAVHVILRHRLDRQFIAVAGWSVQREVFRQRFVADDHARGVCANVAQAAFHTSGGIEQGLHLIGGFIHLLQISRGF